SSSWASLFSLTKKTTLSLCTKTSSNASTTSDSYMPASSAENVTNKKDLFSFILFSNLFKLILFIPGAMLLLHKVKTNRSVAHNKLLYQTVRNIINSILNELFNLEIAIITAIGCFQIPCLVWIRCCVKRLPLYLQTLVDVLYGYRIST